jgi:hypothetical protein
MEVFTEGRSIANEDVDMEFYIAFEVASFY